MPLFATALLGIVGQAVWKLATHVYGRLTTPGASTAVEPPAKFERSLAEASSAQAVTAGRALCAPTALSQDLVALPDTGTISFGSRPPAMASVVETYRRMAEIQTA